MYIVTSETQSNPFLCYEAAVAKWEIFRQMNDGGMGNIWLVDIEQRTIYFYAQLEDGSYADGEVKTLTLTYTDLLRGIYAQC